MLEALDLYQDTARAPLVLDPAQVAAKEVEAAVMQRGTGNHMTQLLQNAAGLHKGNILTVRFAPSTNGSYSDGYVCVCYMHINIVLTECPSLTALQLTLSSPRARSTNRSKLQI